MLDKNWEYNEAVHQDFRKAYVSVRSEVQYSDRVWGTRGTIYAD
jgi:hypothetical protein